MLSGIRGEPFSTPKTMGATGSINVEEKPGETRGKRTKAGRGGATHLRLYSDFSVIIVLTGERINQKKFSQKEAFDNIVICF